jgi:hypothetical protein
LQSGLLNIVVQFSLLSIWWWCYFRVEFDLAIKSGDLKRALQALVIMSNSKGFSQDVVDLGLEKTGILSIASTQEAKAEALIGIVKFAQEFLDLIDAADATGQGGIAKQALTRLAAAGSVEGGLSPEELRALSFRLALHGELTRLQVRLYVLVVRVFGLVLRKLNSSQWF